MPSCRKIRVAAAMVVLGSVKKRKDRKWVKDWIQRRDTVGIQMNLLMELKNEEPSQYKNFLRMTEDNFNMLLSDIRPIIEKQDTKMRAAIPARVRLYVTLRYLATGDSFHSLSYLFRIPVCTISIIVMECCLALYDRLHSRYLKMPTSETEWLEIAKGFEEKWNFPHCIGALDGKHIQIQAPANSGSFYYNYKGTHSIVLLALVDSFYRFIYVNIGCNGRISDGGVFNNCNLSRALENNTLNLPLHRPLPGSDKVAPYVIVADDAFALKPYLMKPYGFRNQPGPNRIFNYRLSRARNTVEDVFGHVASRFRVLRTPIMLSPIKTRNVVAAICILHNFLIERNPNYLLHQENNSLHSLLPLQSAQQNNPPVNAKSVREQFRNYFVSPEGEISWQYTKI